ncbi:hypothetical protein EGI22_20070 [Lacihabitans sp. LS3-19]|uniref:alpha-amylase family glycosyl hydrolase n=1 Tax=Lacihabitans sp. LS3-19 TaxID=2487335 RepID=UPI0020CCBB99|nr:alpha-amylase family glycosyl hydrolase [Lacihabitans sp. LS3-19]MCP9770208.1 hypothetical protein [Lacihabitans sp. LS3-19]
MKKSIFLFTFFFAYYAHSQKISFDPIDWQADQSVTINFDFNGTSFSGYSGDLYLWSWVNNGAGQGFDAPNNGTWANSSISSKLTDLGGNLRSITILPNTFFGLHEDFLKASGINFLVKKLDGNDVSGGVPGKTQDFANIYPFANEGIQANINWSGNKPIRLMVDLGGTSFSGFVGPLFLWSYYNNGGGNINSPYNGSWTNSNPASQCTRIGSSDLWYIDFVPNTYFGTSASNLTKSTVFGLIKKQNGNDGQTADFGLNKTGFKKYIIYQKNASNVSLSLSLPPDNVPVTFTFTASDNLIGTSQKVFMHSGVVTEGLASIAWNHTQGLWGDSLISPGQMTKIGSDVYTLTIPSIRDYYQLSSAEKAFKIMAVFRSADGTIIEKDGSSDFQLLLETSRYLETREPSGSFIAKQINKPFRITGFTNQISEFSMYVNGNLEHSSIAANRSSFLYTPTSEGIYTIIIKANNGISDLADTVKVSVCSSNPISLSSTLPTGLKYGINYSVDYTKATLVLHAPTENINSVHVVGDFNNWSVNCNFLMNYDASKKVFWKEINSLSPGQEYVFQYLIDGKTRIGDPYTEKVSDPWNDSSISGAVYPGLIQYPTEAMPKNGETPTIASVLQTQSSQFNWQIENFNRIPQNKLNIYQLHFRDFTTEGTYLAAISKLDYLKRMGINAIETLPVSEFEGNDSWGYNPNYYFAVDKAYGTKNDYKTFVDECHIRGISVIGDMVLNHAFGTNPHARMYWDDLNNRPATNNPWFNAVSNFSNPAAQWGNDFNHESPHTQAFVDSVIHFWLTEFKIDGIRFDFTKGFGNTPYPNGLCADEWGGCYDASRIALLKRMADKMWLIDNGATGSQPYVIMEHLANVSEDKTLADYSFGINLWSGVSPNNKYSEIAMGWAPDAGDPNKSNLAEVYYKNKTYNNPTWVSYMESHDEERIAYKQTQYGNGLIKTDLVLRSKFLQVSAAMNLLFTGPRQIWQFGELGYDYSINYNGRTGKKPIRWDYFDVPERRNIYETYARLFWLRNRMPLTFHKDFDNLGGAKTDLVSQFKRYHFYSSVGDTAVTIIANTANSVITGNPDFNASLSSQWYEYFSQTWQTVSSSITLQPGEFRLYFNKKPNFLAPDISLVSYTNAPKGADTTSLQISFPEPVLKRNLNDFLGANIVDFTKVFELKDAENNVHFFSGTISFDNKKVLIKPNVKLYSGNYTLKIIADSVQNYGGIRPDNDIYFNFSIEATPRPCVLSSILSSPLDDFFESAEIIQSASTIEATNKIILKSRVDYDAKNAVILNPGFEIKPNDKGYFLAKIGGCDL